MKKAFAPHCYRLPLQLFLICGAMLVAGCGIQNERVASTNFYDLGPITANAAGTAPTAQPAIAVTVADVAPAVWLDSQLIFYRLLYANAQQTSAYAQQRWLMQPTALFTQRLKARIVQAGGAAASAVDGPTNLPQLRIEADDFTHVFESPNKSYGNIVMRASLYNGRTLISQKAFTAHAPAPSNDAAGGARALAAASDAMITDMMNWLASQPVRR
jgi:cholesterol transport system auxiliary component